MCLSYQRVYTVTPRRRATPSRMHFRLSNMKTFTCLFLLLMCSSVSSVAAKDSRDASENSAPSPATGLLGLVQLKDVGGNPVALNQLAKSAEQELRGNILPFWLKYTRNTQRGGFFGLIDENMKSDSREPRGALLTSRILWTFSSAYRAYHDPQYLEMARWAYRDLTDNFQDKESGGLFWTITAEGKPLDTRKQIYGQVFGIYALAEYYRATGDQPALDQAIAIYRLVKKNQVMSTRINEVGECDINERALIFMQLGIWPDAQQIAVGFENVDVRIL